MTYKVEFSSSARADARKAQRWYEEKALGLGARFAQALARQSRALSPMPEMYKEVRNGIRLCAVPKFPYELYYKVEGRRVIILAVHAVRQDPDVLFDKLQDY